MVQSKVNFAIWQLYLHSTSNEIYNTAQSPFENANTSSFFGRYIKTKYVL